MRRGADAAPAGDFSRDSRVVRRRAAADFAGRPAGSVSSRRPRQGHGLLGARELSSRRFSVRCWAAGSPTATTWRWVFYINLPVGILSILMVHWFVFDPSYIKRDLTARIDYWGIGMLAVWIAALQIAFDKGQQLDWFSSPFIVWLLVIAGYFRDCVPGPGTDGGAPGREPPHFQGAELRRRRIPDGGAGIRALWQHRDPAHLAPDADGISGDASRDDDGAARSGIDGRHAAGRHHSAALRPAQAAGDRARCWARFPPGSSAR